MTETLTPFEEIIVAKMIEHYGCHDDEARTIINKYLPVIRLLDDQYDSARLQAIRYFEAHQKGVDPAKWVEKIHRLNRIHKMDSITSNPYNNLDIQTQITQTLQNYPQDVVKSVVSKLYPTEPRVIRVAVPISSKEDRQPSTPYLPVAQVRTPAAASFAFAPGTGKSTLIKRAIEEIIEKNHTQVAGIQLSKKYKKKPRRGFKGGVNGLRHGRYAHINWGHIESSLTTPEEPMKRKR